MVDRSNGIKELNELIDLAEKVSISKSNYQSLLMKSLLSGLVYFGAGFGSLAVGAAFERKYSELTWFYIIVFATMAITWIASAFYVTAYLRTMKDLRVETDILHKLLSMIDELKNANRRDIGVVENAIMEMRLTRIKFSAQGPFHFN